MEKTSAVVIRTADFKEADRMLTLLTKDFGLIFAKVKSAKKQTSKLFSSSNLFCCGEYEFYEKNGYYGVRGCSITHTFQKLSEDYDAFAAACFIADAAGRVAQEQYPAPKLFALVVNALFALETKVEPDTVICYFIQRLLYIEGLYPGIDECVICGKNEAYFFSAEQGGVLCSECARSHNGERIDENVIKALRAMEGIVPKGIGCIRIEKDTVQRLKQLLISYLENVSSGQLKTSKFVRQNRL